MRIIKETAEVMVLKDRGLLAILVGILCFVISFVIIFYPNIFEQPPSRWQGLSGGAFFILVGLLVVIRAESATITLDKNMNKLMFVRQTLITKKNKIEEYYLDQIKAVELREIYTKKQKPQNEIVFVLNSGQEIVIQRSQGIIKFKGIFKSMGKQLRVEKATAERIAAFLNVPCQERRPPTVSEVLNTVRETVEKEIQKAQKEDIKNPL